MDEILEQIGGMGRFQITRLVMFCFLMFPPTFQFLNMYFIVAEAPWQCVNNSTECKLNGSFVVGDFDYDFRCKINRSEWEYASYEGPHNTIVSEFDLVCDYANYGSLAVSIGSISEAIFTIPLGVLSDRFGRLWTLYPSLVIMTTVGTLSSFAAKYWHFLVARIFSGSATFGVIFTITILSGEYVGPHHRPLSQTIVWVASTFETLLLACMAYFVRSWRNLVILCNAPWILLLVFAKFTPESVRWQLTHNKAEKAEKNLRQIAKVNKIEYPDVTLKIPEVSNEGRFNCLALFSSWSSAIGVLIQAFAWFVSGLVFFGASFGASDFGGNLYLNFALTILIEIPANFIAIDGCERFGRKKIIIYSMILSGIACVVVSLIPAGTARTDFIAGRLIGGMLGKGFITISYSSMVVWSTELFPTIVRNSGMAILYVSTSFGSAAAPFVLDLDRIHGTLPFGLMGGLSAIASLLCLKLPETRGRPTVEVFESNRNAQSNEMPEVNGKGNQNERGNNEKEA